jgi:hypothetical protein
LGERASGIAIEDALAALHELYEDAYPVAVGAGEISAYQAALIGKVEKNDAELARLYREAQVKIADFFEAWFDGKAKV